MKSQNYRMFSQQEHQTWKTLFDNLAYCRKEQAFAIFDEGVKKLGLNANAIPDIDEVNRKLLAMTGWQGVPVEGLEQNASFFVGLSERKFPIGNFIRDARDVNYTPAPDVFHDLYGHLPFFVDRSYAKFTEEFGIRASAYRKNERALDLWGRLFWFGVEFSLVKADKGRRIFGGGILSSLGESNYSLSQNPVVLPFSVQEIIDRPYKIDEFQKTIFCLESTEQLYNCLPAYEKAVKARI